MTDQLDLFAVPPAPIIKPKGRPDTADRAYKAFIYWLRIKAIHVTGTEKTFEEKARHELMDRIVVAGTKSRLLAQLGGLAAVW